MNYNLVPLRQVVSEVSDCENPSLGEEHISGVATGEELQERIGAPPKNGDEMVFIHPKKKTQNIMNLNQN